MPFFFQAEDGIRDCLLSRGLGDVYKRQARTRAARRELARLRGERYFDYGYDPISCDTWLRRFSSHPLPINARFWYKSSDGLWWSGKISSKRDDHYIVRLVDDPAPTRLRLQHDLYTTALDAPVGSWCPKHRAPPLGTDTSIGRVSPLAPSAATAPASGTTAAPTSA